MNYGTIYEPKGRAREYAELACNVYTGCSHGCLYCYAPSAIRKTREEFAQAKVRPGFLAKLQNDAERWTGPKKQVLLSFTSDPFQPDPECTAIQAIQILKDNGFPVCVLTKGGSRALEALPLFGAGDSFASTLTCLDDSESLKWEPGAALPADRISTLQTFHDAGIQTWVSLEPTLSPDVSIEIIRQTHQFVDLYKVGKLNYHEFGKSIDWAGYTDAAVRLLASLEKPYIIKDDLAKFIPAPAGFPQRLKTD